MMRHHKLHAFCAKLLAFLLCCGLTFTHAAAELPDPFGKYSPAITATFARATDDILDTNFFAIHPDKSWTDNLWVDLYREELGISISYDWIAAEGSEHEQKLRIAVSSGDIPQFLNVDAAQLRQLVEMGAVAPLGEAYEDYAAPLTREVLGMMGADAFRTATFDGKLYGLPLPESYMDGADLLWIRVDWLDRLNLTPPKTMDEALTVMAAFADADMNGNGIDDEYGIVFTKSLWNDFASLRGFFNGFAAYPGIWVPYGDDLVFGSTLPGCKDALAELRKLAELGAIEPEFGIKDSTPTAELVIKGKVGLLYGMQWNPLWPLQSNKDLDPRAQWKAFPIVFTPDAPQKVQSNYITTHWTVCRKDVPYPEAIVKMYNLFIEKCWGETEENAKYYAPLDAESIWKLSPVTPYLPVKNKLAYQSLDAARRSGDYSGITGEATSILTKLRLYESGSAEGFALWGWERIYGENGAYGVLCDYDERGMYLVDQFLGMPGNTMTDRMGTLLELQDEVFTQIILGEIPLDAFDKWVEDFYALGGDQITRDVNEWYHSR
jgi:putative aldouronate transport system substrate-binding protein